VGLPIGPPDDSSDDSEAGEYDVQLKHTTIKELGPGTSHLFVHSYLVVTIGGTSEVEEGIGTPSILNGYLNAYHSQSGSLQDDHPGTDTTDFDAQNTGLSGIQICKDAVREAERSYESQANNSVSYNLLGKKNPNSNSFARYLLSFAPDFGNVHHSRRAVGWSTLVLGR
jgi:hypothetical protein